MKTKEAKNVNVGKDSLSLSIFLNDRFTKNERTVAIDKIADTCYVSRQVVYNWIYGHSRIPELYKHKIEEIFETPIFNQIENL